MAENEAIGFFPKQVGFRLRGDFSKLPFFFFNSYLSIFFFLIYLRVKEVRTRHEENRFCLCKMSQGLLRSPVQPISPSNTPGRAQSPADPPCAWTLGVGQGAGWQQGQMILAFLQKVFIPSPLVRTKESGESRIF